MSTALQQLSKNLDGALTWDDLHRTLYATDASVYQITPLAVAYPKHSQDIKTLIAFATKHKVGLIPRTAGTSLAGQCVGDGIVVDVSKHFTSILNLDVAQRQVTVQPGVIRDELNTYLKPYGLFFGPNTSTSNRCMIGGMVGNNSSGTTSIRYGVTRDKVVSLSCILSDQSEVVFETVDAIRFREKRNIPNLEGAIYRDLHESLESTVVQERIQQEYPKATIHRRNTGYAIDVLSRQQPFTATGEPFNICNLLAGSEGTLAFTTAITLSLDPLPPSEHLMVAAHFASIEQCMRAVTLVMQHPLFTCEMMDKVILDCTKNNREQLKNRFFIEDDPAAILLLELRAGTQEDLAQQLEDLLQDIVASKLAYAYPVLRGTQVTQALDLRKAGLGLLGNMTGDRKAVACIEDTAVALPDLEAYIADFTSLMKSYDQQAVYYAHAGAGELHLRPILNLKNSDDVQLFRAITQDVAKLVKRYKGSLSGEHGDGIVRGEFLELMIGYENYQILRSIKHTFDPLHIFNPGKIIDPLPMDQQLRYESGRVEPEIDTVFDFKEEDGILRFAEQCNGSGDCRKLPESGGTMCPSYRATRDEKDTTRARANALRTVLTAQTEKNSFDSPVLKDVFDLCLSCKACASECPSNVDVATLKAEFEYHYQQVNGISLRTKAFAYSTQINKWAAKVPRLTNALYRNTLSASIIKRTLGIAQQRSLPPVQLFKQVLTPQKASGKKVVLVIDEFTQYLDGTIGQDAYMLLQGLGYQVTILTHIDTGRAFISKGLLDQAKKCADTLLSKLEQYIATAIPILGIEPSAILGLRDEYLRLATDKPLAVKVAKQSFLIEEFLYAEMQAGTVHSDQFTTESKTLKIHGHCHQKSLSAVSYTFDLLNLPINYKPTIISSGCCGMAGSFGYEKDKYALSMQIGEQTLFPAIRKADEATIIVANGTSCRHQIKDGTQRKTQHPVTVLRKALRAYTHQSAETSKAVST